MARGLDYFEKANATGPLQVQVIVAGTRVLFTDGQFAKAEESVGAI
jgi:hypothetical protein